jgi:hypothetical protein
MATVVPMLIISAWLIGTALRLTQRLTM